MAAIEDYRTRRGEPRIQVRWQQRTTTGIVRQSMTFAERVDAERFIRMLEALGGDGEKASAAVGGANLPIETVREVILAYIEANHRAAPAQLRKYRNQVRDHFDDTLGHTPIDRVDADAIQGAVQCPRHTESMRGTKTSPERRPATWIPGGPRSFSACRRDAVTPITELLP